MTVQFRALAINHGTTKEMVSIALINESVNYALLYLMVKEVLSFLSPTLNTSPLYFQHVSVSLCLNNTPNEKDQYLGDDDATLVGQTMVQCEYTISQTIMG